MLKCKLFERKLSSFIDGELSPGEKEKIIHHIGTCNKCGEQYNFYLNLDTDLKQFMLNKTKYKVPYKEPYIEVIKEMQLSEKEKRDSIFSSIKEYLETEVIVNGNINSLRMKLLIGSNWIRAINVLFIVLGFLLLLATPIHGSEIDWIIERI